ncbi:class I SAM-dependent methyltransferase [Methylomonas fluvii]|uniref:Class I SAM-dependent methyltransferase n=1 Tax=Methylomonas fluvii TaxID=1854564 RepID=A0ABR9DJ53_9GAMM|nr:class I SAM-dependent methyltransferase [Methylomonas fluvii]MBD9363135.1 class I SAM-dependent methyltransferase [Methylomonas fluvii]
MGTSKNNYNYDVALSYERDRQCEAHWEEENLFIQEYFSCNKHKGILDVPVGTGRFFQFYPDNSRVVGVDISINMLAQSQEKAALIDNSDIFLMLSNAEKLAFHDDSFDIVVCCRLFHLLTQDERFLVLKELGRVTKKTILLQVYLSNKSEILYAFSARIKKLKDRFLRKRCDTGLELKPWSHIMSYSLTRTQLKSLIRRTGLSVIKESGFSCYEGNIVGFLVLNK